MSQAPDEVARFNKTAAEYNVLHQQSVAASGESIDYFALYKLNRLLLAGVSPNSKVLDYGCGIGNLTTQLAPVFAEVLGYDPSENSIEIARAAVPTAKFVADPKHITDGAFDVAVVAGVLHHIAPAERPAVLLTIQSKLKPGGKLFVFEHNPYNPLTRRAVETCPFDEDAILLPPGEVRVLLKQAGYTAVSQRFIVFFPRIFSFLRWLEPWLGFCPLGAQTMTCGERR